MAQAVKTKPKSKTQTKARMSKQVAKEALAKAESKKEILEAVEEKQCDEIIVQNNKADIKGTVSFDVKLTEELSNRLVENQEDPLSVAQEFKNQAFTGYFRLGGTLAYIYANNLYEKYGYEGRGAFDKFIVERLGMANRRARYFMQIYAAFISLDIPESRLTNLGWSKASYISDLVTKDNVEELLVYAETHTYEELMMQVKTVYKKDESIEDEETILRGAEKTSLKHIKISVFEDQYASVIEPMLNMYKNQYPQYANNPSQLFVAIIADAKMKMTEETNSLTMEGFVDYGNSVFAEYEVQLVNRNTGEKVTSETLKGTELAD